MIVVDPKIIIKITRTIKMIIILILMMIIIIIIIIIMTLIKVTSMELISILCCSAYVNTPSLR